MNVRAKQYLNGVGRIKIEIRIEIFIIDIGMSFEIDALLEGCFLL